LARHNGRDLPEYVASLATRTLFIVWSSLPNGWMMVLTRRTILREYSGRKTGIPETTWRRSGSRAQVSRKPTSRELIGNRAVQFPDSASTRRSGSEEAAFRQRDFSKKYSLEPCSRSNPIATRAGAEVPRERWGLSMPQSLSSEGVWHFRSPRLLRRCLIVAECALVIFQ